MKLKDLREDLYNTTTKDVTVNRDLNRKSRTNDDTTLGSGAFASVSDKKNDPFMVRKTSHSDRKMDISKFDGYWTYIQGIVENPSLKNNPFLPRVYNVKKIKDASGKIVMRADIEKLQNGNVFEMDMLLSYFNNVLNADLSSFEDDDVDELLMQAAFIMESAVDYNDYSKIKNSYLIQALKYIGSLKRSYGIDIHEGNIMFRTGGQGIQLVITDPVSGSLE